MTEDTCKDECPNNTKSHRWKNREVSIPPPNEILDLINYLDSSEQLKVKQVEKENNNPTLIARGQRYVRPDPYFLE